jgi:phospholipase/carboxylesterase
MLALLCLFLGVSNMAQAQAALQSDLPLPYLAQAPAGADNRPLIIFLHGYGSNENDLFALREHLPPDDIYLSVRAPITLAPGAYEWFQSIRTNDMVDGKAADLDTSGNDIASFIGAAVRKYRTKRSRVVLIGFSQGAIMSYQIGLGQPDDVGGIAILSGIILPGLLSRLEHQKHLRGPAIFIGHGTADTRLPFASADHDRQWLESRGLRPEFHAYAGMQHEVSTDEISQLDHWLETSFPNGETR